MLLFIHWITFWLQVQPLSFDSNHLHFNYIYLSFDHIYLSFHYIHLSFDHIHLSFDYIHLSSHYIHFSFLPHSPFRSSESDDESMVAETQFSRYHDQTARHRGMLVWRNHINYSIYRYTYFFFRISYLFLSYFEEKDEKL